MNIYIHICLLICICFNLFVLAWNINLDVCALEIQHKRRIENHAHSPALDLSADARRNPSFQGASITLATTACRALGEQYDNAGKVRALDERIVPHIVRGKPTRHHMLTPRHHDTYTCTCVYIKRKYIYKYKYIYMYINKYI